MVWACEKNVSKQDRPGVAGMEAKHRQAPEAGQRNDGWTMSRRLSKSQDLHTEGDRTISTVSGQKSMEKLRH